MRSELIATDTEREDMGRPKTPTQPQTHAKVPPSVKRITELTELVFPPAATVTEILGAQDGIDTAESSSQDKGSGGKQRLGQHDPGARAFENAQFITNRRGR